MEPCASVVDSNGENEINQVNDESHNAEQHSVSKFKRAASQYCATLASSLLTLTIGMSIGFSTILIPELYKKDAEILVTLEELTWISSMNYILITFGAAVSGMLAQWLGRRYAIMILTIPYIVSWIILHYATNVTMLFVALILTGISGGLAESPTQTYVAEISEPTFRGPLSATVSMHMMIGIFLQFLIGGYFYWRTLVLINLAFPIACFVAMLFVPESPHWLASKKRFNETERSLSWLRGWTSPNNIKYEYQSLFGSMHNLSMRKSKNYDETNHSNYQRQSLKEIFKPYLRRTVLLPFATVSFAFFISCFNGSTPILTFAIVLFEKFKSPINEYTATMIMGLLKVFASFLLIFLIHYTGKRILIFTSLIGTGLSLFAVAIYGFIENYYKIDMKDYSWIPTSMILISIFASTLGIKGIPWIISGEVFPTDVRSVANGLVSSTCNIYAAIASKVFLYMIQSMTLEGTFLFFALINVIGLIILYIILPETEGRSLKEIEEHYAGIRKLKDRPKTNGTLA